MTYTVSGLRETALSDLYAVYEMFKDFFGEEYVDLQDIPSDDQMKEYLKLQNCAGLSDSQYELDERQYENIRTVIRAWDTACIMVWWPKVKVVNEYDRYVWIDDLYAKISINGSGLLNSYKPLVFTRASYTKNQWLSDYCHSHLPRIPQAGAFENPCLGKGPIRNTIDSLHTDNDLLLWQLFCQELAMYVTVESLRGVPYHRLESIRSGVTQMSGYESPRYNSRWESFKDTFPDGKLQEFIHYYLEHGKLRFSFVNGNYCPGLSYHDYMMDVSNCLIDWINKSCLPDSCNLGDCFITMISDGNHLYFLKDNFYRTREQEIERRQGSFVCFFKNRRITLRIYDNENDNSLNTVRILENNIAMHLLQNILQTLNYYTLYGIAEKEHKFAGTDKAPIYI